MCWYDLLKHTVEDKYPGLVFGLFKYFVLTAVINYLLSF